VGVGHGFGNCFNNWERSGHRGVVIVGGGVIVRGSSDQRYRSRLDLNRFSSLDRGSGGNIWNIGVVSVGVVVVAIVASIVVVASIVIVEPVVSVVVRVVAIVVVGSVVSISLSLSFGFSLGLRVSRSFGQTGLLQSTDSATVGSDAIMRGKRATGKGDTGRKSSDGGGGNGIGGKNGACGGGGHGY
jgi:hypothetical protein